MKESGVWESGNEGEREQGVSPPPEQMQRGCQGGVGSEGLKPAGDHVPERRNTGQGCGLTENAETFEDVAGEADGGEEGQYEPVSGAVFERSGTAESTDGEDQASGEQGDTGDVHRNFEHDIVDAKVEDGLIGGSSQGRRQEVLDGDQRGPEQKHEEAAIEQCMGPVGRWSAAESAQQEHVAEEPTGEGRHWGRVGSDPPEAPETAAAKDPVCQDQDRDGSDAVEEPLRGGRDAAENLPRGSPEGRGFGSGDGRWQRLSHAHASMLLRGLQSAAARFRRHLPATRSRRPRTWAHRDRY